jgi:diguanylate cyclase (GGDEF)-like protein
LEKAVENLREHNVPFSLLALDIDYFKKVNDTFGHNAGDELLREVAQLMKVQARDLDIVCRSGGEEFMIFLANTDVSQAFEVAERIRKSMETHNFAVVSSITISIGVSHWAGQPESIESVMKEADKALYKAKENGRNRTELGA